MAYNNIAVIDADVEDVVDNAMKQRDVYRNKYQTFKALAEATVQNVEEMRDDLTGRVKKSFDLIVKAFVDRQLRKMHLPLQRLTRIWRRTSRILLRTLRIPLWTKGARKS